MADELRSVSCFGKLPFQREFLRVRLDVAGGAWMVRWVEGAHHAMVVPESSDGQDAPWVRFAVPHEDVTLLGIVRPSSDGGRRHPFALFREVPAVGRDDWYLVPQAFDGAWAALEGAIDESIASLDDLQRRLDALVLHIDLDAARAHYEAATGTALEAPWNALVGLDGEPAGHVALNLLAVSRAQRDARCADEGVCVAMPLSSDAAVATAYAGAWIRLFDVAAGEPDIVPALALVRRPHRLVAFYRPAEGSDLAALLGGAQEPPIDDLTENWQEFPPQAPEIAADVERLMSTASATISSLSDRVSA